MAIPLKLRKKIHRLYRKSRWTQKMVADELGVSRSAVQQILNRHPDDLEIRQGSGNSGKIHQKEIECIAELYSAEPKATLQMYVNELFDKCDVEVTPQTVHLHLKKIKEMNMK